MRYRKRLLRSLGFPNHMVDTEGRVYTRISRNGKGGLGEWRQLGPCRGGSVLLRDLGKVFWTHISVLVLTAFVSPRPPGKEVCHFPDPDPTNNALRNVRWGTHRENEEDKKYHGTWDRCHGFGGDNPHGIPHELAAAIRRERRATGMSYDKLGKKFGVATMTAWNVVNGRTHSKTMYADQQIVT